MMWDQMKQFQSGLVAEILQKCPSLKCVSEQTIHTIASDVAEFREYKPNELIMAQDTDSPYNIVYQCEEREALKKFMDNAGQTPQFSKVKSQQFENLCKEREILGRYSRNMHEMRVRESNLPKFKIRHEKVKLAEDEDSPRQDQYDLSGLDPCKLRKAQMELQALSELQENPVIAEFRSFQMTYPKEYEVVRQTLEAAKENLAQFQGFRKET